MKQANSGRSCDRNVACREGSRTSTAGSAGKLESASRRGSDSGGTRKPECKFMCAKPEQTKSLPGCSKPPEAELTDATGKKIAHHFAGPTLEACRWKRSEG